MRLLHLLFCVVGLFLCISCSAPPEGLRVAPDSGKSAGYPTFGEPILLKNAEYVLVPFWIQVPQEQKMSLELSGSGSWSGGYQGHVSMSSAFGSYQTAGAIRWNNILVYEKATGRSHLLLDHKAVISKAFFPESLIGDGALVGASKLLLLGIVAKDYNGDGYINDDDGVSLFAVDPLTSTLIRLTPEGTNLDEIVADGPDTIYIRIIRDSDGDRHFTLADEAQVLRINLRHPAEGLPLIDEPTRKRAKAILEGK